MYRSKITSLFVLLVTVIPTLTAHAAPQLSAYDFEAIVDLGNCSGSLVRFDDSSPSDPGLILTNGHCVKLIPAGTVIIDQSSRKIFTLYNHAMQRVGNLRATRLLFATMTKTDVALYQLQDTYADIFERYAVEPLTLTRQPPEVGTDIEVVSGRWERGYSCQIEAQVHTLQEGNWLMSQSIRYSRPGCEVVGGTSGSPVIEAGTRTVVAINNTGNDNGRRCEINNPCEIDEDGKVTFQKGFNYAQQVWWFYDCRDQTGNLDLRQPECQLSRP